MEQTCIDLGQFIQDICDFHGFTHPAITRARDCDGGLRPESAPIHRCGICDAGIYEFDRYYNIEGDAICEDCIDKFARTAIAS